MSFMVKSGQTHDKQMISFLEIRMILLQFQVLGEIINDEGFESGCISRELGAVICRAGCQICSLRNKMEHLKKICPNLNDGPGMNPSQSRMSRHVVA